jgi:hypothetical protein
MNKFLTKIEMLEVMARRHLRRLDPVPKPIRIQTATVSPTNGKVAPVSRPQGWSVSR